MPIKYADIVKQENKEQSSDVTIKSDTNIVEEYKKPKRTEKRNHNYNIWEYAYFPYLIEMYYLIYDEWDNKNMYDFCKFIYSVSSGKICSYLNEMTSEQEDIYFQYIIKRNNV